MSRLARALALLIAASAASVLVNQAPAAAATTLRETDPPSNGVVQSLPQLVRLTFTEPLPGAPTITVAGPTGRTVNSSPVSLRGNTVLQPVQGTEAGRYTVTWRASTSEGTDINGTFAFTVAGGAPSPTGQSSNEPSPTVPVVVGSSPSDFGAGPGPSSTADADRSGDGSPWPWIVAGLGAVVVVVALVWYARRRRAGSG